MDLQQFLRVVICKSRASLSLPIALCAGTGADAGGHETGGSQERELHEGDAVLFPVGQTSSERPPANLLFPAFGAARVASYEGQLSQIIALLFSRGRSISSSSLPRAAAQLPAWSHGGAADACAGPSQPACPYSSWMVGQGHLYASTLTWLPRTDMCLFRYTPQ